MLSELRGLAAKWNINIFAYTLCNSAMIIIMYNYISQHVSIIILSASPCSNSIIIKTYVMRFVNLVLYLQ